VMVDIGFKYVETDLETDFTPFIQNIWTIQNEIRFWHAQESYWTTIDWFFHCA
jgi:hypothetical protein